MLEKFINSDFFLKNADITKAQKYVFGALGVLVVATLIFALAI